MWIKTITLISAVFFIASGGAAAPPALERLRDENRLLKAELALAGKPALYLVLDLNEKKVYLKGSGSVLKEWQVRGARLWGSQAPAKPVKLLNKSALLEPRREKIKPKKPDEEEEATTDTFDIKALELKDMPGSYSLWMSEGVLVSVRPFREGILSLPARLCRFAKWYATRPLLTVWNAVWGKPFTAIEVTLDEADAQALYWAVPEGIENLIYYPVSDD